MYLFASLLFTFSISSCDDDKNSIVEEDIPDINKPHTKDCFIEIDAYRYRYYEYKPMNEEHYKLEKEKAIKEGFTFDEKNNKYSFYVNYSHNPEYHIEEHIYVYSSEDLILDDDKIYDEHGFVAGEILLEELENSKGYYKERVYDLGIGIGKSNTTVNHDLIIKTKCGAAILFKITKD